MRGTTDRLRAGARWVTCAALLALTLSAPPLTHGADEGPDLPTLLHRAGAYVERYARTFKDVVAEEHYRQWWQDPRTAGLTVRTLRSDMVFAIVPGPLPWTTFRDVYEVDGNAVRDREARLERLFIESPRSAVEQAHAILRESSRHNLGPESGQSGYRTINVPTLGLLFLQPENQRRLSFERKGARAFEGLGTIEVKFVEETTPTLVHDSWQNDVPARGRFWIEPSQGIVLRTEVEYDLEPETRERRQLAFVATQYRREPGLDIFVPGEMKEWYKLPSGRIEGTARYSNYRRFRVSTAESNARSAPPDTGVAPPPSGGMTVDLAGGGGTAEGPVIGVAPPKPPEPAPEPEREAAPTRPGAIGPLLQRAGEYVRGYEETFRTVAAREECQEWFRAGDGRTDVRTLRSEVVFAMVAGPSPWILYRDVVEVGGHDVGEGEGRLARLFRESPGAAAREASAIDRESERLLHPPERRMRVPLPVPTAALAYLHPDHQDRFTFELAGRTTHEGRDVARLRFEETAQPTMVVDGDGRDLPARGTLVLREDDGALLEAEVDYRFASRHGETMRVTTAFAAAPDLGILVPAEMRQVVELGNAAERATPPRLGARGLDLEAATLGARVDTRLRYSEFQLLAREP